MTQCYLIVYLVLTNEHPSDRFTRTAESMQVTEIVLVLCLVTSAHGYTKLSLNGNSWKVRNGNGSEWFSDSMRFQQREESGPATPNHW